MNEEDLGSKVGLLCSFLSCSFILSSLFPCSFDFSFSSSESWTSEYPPFHPFGQLSLQSPRWSPNFFDLTILFPFDGFLFDSPSQVFTLRPVPPQVKGCPRFLRGVCPLKCPLVVPPFLYIFFSWLLPARPFCVNPRWLLLSSQILRRPFFSEPQFSANLFPVCTIFPFPHFSSPPFVRSPLPRIGTTLLLPPFLFSFFFKRLLLVIPPPCTLSPHFFYSWPPPWPFPTLEMGCPQRSLVFSSFQFLENHPFVLLPSDSPVDVRLTLKCPSGWISPLPIKLSPRIVALIFFSFPFFFPCCPFFFFSKMWPPWRFDTFRVFTNRCSFFVVPFVWGPSFFSIPDFFLCPFSTISSPMPKNWQVCAEKCDGFFFLWSFYLVNPLSPWLVFPNWNPRGCLFFFFWPLAPPMAIFFFFFFSGDSFKLFFFCSLFLSVFPNFSLAPPFLPPRRARGMLQFSYF